MLWDPFLIKKLLKSVICGTVNSTHMHCSQLTKSTIAGWEKKEENVEKKRRRGFQLKANGHLKFIFLLTFVIFLNVCGTSQKPPQQVHTC